MGLYLLSRIFCGVCVHPALWKTRGHVHRREGVEWGDISVRRTLAEKLCNLAAMNLGRTLFGDKEMFVRILGKKDKLKWSVDEIAACVLVSAMTDQDKEKRG